MQGIISKCKYHAASCRAVTSGGLLGMLSQNACINLHDIACLNFTESGGNMNLYSSIKTARKEIIDIAIYYSSDLIAASSEITLPLSVIYGKCMDSTLLFS